MDEDLVDVVADLGLLLKIAWAGLGVEEQGVDTTEDLLLACWFGTWWSEAK